MEQAHHKWIVDEEEEEEQQQLLECASLEGRKTLQHRKDSIIVAPSFTLAPINDDICSVEEEPLLQKEEEQKEPLTEKGEEENAVNYGEAMKSATINVAASQNMTSVYLDKEQGMWKCHHCTWTKQFDSTWNVPPVNLSGYSDLLMNVKTMAQHGPCFVCETKGNEADGERSVLPKSSGERNFDIRLEDSNIQSSPIEAVDGKIQSGSELSPLLNSSEVQATTVENFGGQSSAKSYPNLTEEIDPQLKEFDVEAVLAKQETHDLFCPNCKSCITKRVILRKRKRNIPNPNLESKSKRDKSDTELVNGAIHEANNQGGHEIATSDVGRIEPTADNYEPETEPELFRCLSCFSFFIPMRNGIKLFPSFGGTRRDREPETSQNPSVLPSSNMESPSLVATSNANWFFTLFTLNKWKKTSGQGDSSIENSRTGPAEQHPYPEIGDPESPVENATISNDIKPTSDIKPGHEGANSLILSKVITVKIESQIDKGNTSSMVVLKNEPLVDQNDLSSTQSSTESSSEVMKELQKVRREQLLTDNVITDVGEKRHASVDMIKTDTSPMNLSDEAVADIPKRESVPLATDAPTEMPFNAEKPAKDDIPKPYERPPIFDKPQQHLDKKPEIALDSYSSSMVEALSLAQSFGSAVVEDDVASDKQSPGVLNVTIPSDQEFKKVQKDIEEEISPPITKEKKEAVKSSTLTADDVPVKGVTVTQPHTEIDIGEQPRAEIGEHQEWQVLKSVVYGGLIESITSLGIVSSAAASGAAPLDIIALGLANLIGGLFVIGHNLINLKNDQEDRYQELLGRKANFLLHAVVVVLSFIIFGSVPLVVYGLLVSKQYLAEVKIAVVAAASVICIIVLAIGKVYTSTPPKSYAKTVLQYVTMALAASGLSYIAGELFKDLLEKLSSSESGYVITMPLSGTRGMKPPWMSY